MSDVVHENAAIFYDLIGSRDHVYCRGGDRSGAAATEKFSQCQWQHPQNFPVLGPFSIKLMR